MPEFRAGLQPAASIELRHAGGSAGAAGRAVDGLFAVEDVVAGTVFGVLRYAGPHDVAQATDGRLLGMDELAHLVQALAQDRAPADQVGGVVVAHVTE